MPSHIRFTDEKCRALYSYWHSLSVEGQVPAWSDFDPLHIPPLLPYVLILEAGQANEFLIRLAGTKCVEFYGRELRGQSLESLVSQEARAEVRGHLAQVADGPSASVTLMRTPLTAAHGGGMSYTLETIALPMAGKDGGIHRILAAIFILESPPSAPPIGPGDGAWRRDIQDRQYVTIGAPGGTGPSAPGPGAL